MQVVPTNSPIELESLYARSAYITNVNQFLTEQNEAKALAYWLSEFIPGDSLESADDIVPAIFRCIASIDELINDQLNAILHHEKFQDLESSWRGLWYLATQADGIKNIKIRVLDISWVEVAHDLSRSLEFDQSQLFKKIYSEEYGTPGGEPYGVIIGDYEISHKPSAKHSYEDISILQSIGQISMAAFSPFVTGAAPDLFGLDDFSTLGQPLNFDNIFSQTEYIKWRSFRERPEAQFVGLTMPHILMRLPYRKSPGSFKGIHFKEECASRGREKYCWGNAAYAFAAILIREFGNVGWFGHIRGAPRNQEAGGVVTTLPCDVFATDADDVAIKPVTDVIITDIKERELSDLGLIPLCQCYDTPYAAFYSNQSVRRPDPTVSLGTQVNARLSAMLQHVLCGSRIAHYIKVMIRDKVGSFITADECEAFLREWLFRYTTGQEDLEWEEQARYPLREASVSVKDHPGKPGEYICVIRLRPHYQLDHMVSELELVTELAHST